MTDIEPIDPRTATEDDLPAWCELSAAVDRECRPGEIERPVGSFRHILIHPWANHVFARWAARDGSGRLIGVSETSWMDTADNPRSVRLAIEVHPDHRRQGVGTALARPAMEHARANGRDLVTLEAVRDSAGAACAEAHGATRKMLDRRSVLDLTEVDVDALRTWGEPRDGARETYALVQWRDQCPDELVDDLAELRTAMNDAPREELEWDDETWTPEMVRTADAVGVARGDQAWATVVRHLPSGRLIALTDIVGPAGWDAWAFQEDTVVLREHRGHGLGRWVKSANLIALLGDRPSTRGIETWNAGSNQWMLAINDQMGFRPATWWGQYQVDLDALESRLRVPVK